MMKKIIVITAMIIGVSFSISLGPSVWELLNVDHGIVKSPFFNVVIFGLIFMLLGFVITPIIDKLARGIVELVNRQSTPRLLVEMLGALLGMVVGYLISLPFNSLEIPFLSPAVTVILSVLFAYMGYYLVNARYKDIVTTFQNFVDFRKNTIQSKNLNKPATDRVVNFARYKLLDTSVIIDGRIVDIIKTHFIEGTLLIPTFVLHELQLIADSTDNLKRERGRRGLDVLNTLQKNPDIHIETYDYDFKDIQEVDSKLIKLAKLIDAAIITNDYNLNKVSEFQQVRVFNINELANALKPEYIPGEEMTVQIIKEGTERQQGVAYLEDGTMIVVEDGQHYIGKTLDVIVTSALQTAAGRMIFAKIDEE